MRGPARFLAVISFSSSMMIQSVLAIPHFINLEGRLTDVKGNPILSPAQVEFELYQGGSAAGAGSGTVVYQEIATISPASDGTYSYLLGSGSPLNGTQLSAAAFNTTQDVYLQLDIDNQAVLPRMRIVSQAWALMAETIQDGAITTPKIVDGSVINSKLGTDVHLSPAQINGTAIVSQSTGPQTINGNLTVTGALTGAQSITVLLAGTSDYLSYWQSATDATKIDSTKILGTVPPGPHSASHRQGGGDAVQLVPSQIDGTALVAQPTSDQTLTGNLTITQSLAVSQNVSAGSQLSVAGEDVQSHLIPSGMIAMFDQSCPSGWSRFSQLDNLFPLGASTYGGTGGSATHSHTVNPHTHSISIDGAHSHTVNAHTHSISGTTSNASLTGSITTYNGNFQVTDGQCEIGLATESSIFPPTSTSQHNHSINLTSGSASPGTDTQGSHNHGGQTGSASPGTDTQSNIPPYLNVVWCKKN
jgi:hypothetical protein